MPKPKVPTIEELLSNNPGIDPKKLTEFLEFQKLVGQPEPRAGGPALPKPGRRLLIGDPDDDDARTVRLRHSR